MDILDSTIDEIDLSTRCYHSLKNANIDTLRDLIAKSYTELESKGFDRWSLKEIRELLAESGLHLRVETLA
jgi:DNA-directed RNA polymerase subunit alpha